MTELQTLLSALLGFAFYYPLVMAGVWIAGALIFYFHWERWSPLPDDPPHLENAPPVSILVPCRNEADQVRETIEWLLKQKYPDFEIIAVDDASTDGTGEILDELARQHPRVRVLHFEVNQGKAMGLRMAAMASRNEYLVCVDADVLLDPNATSWLVHHLHTGNRVGAVTGNPRVRNRSTLLGRIQVGEFSAIVGLIKRAQRVYGRVFTITGAVSAYRKTALHRSGYWSVDTVTEDLDISWRLQQDRWDIRYEPNALCWLLMPETFRGLWRQRLRWAQGGVEALLHHTDTLLTWKNRRMWGVYLEYVASMCWANTMGVLGIIWIVQFFTNGPATDHLVDLLPAWAGVVLGCICLVQFLISLMIESRYERGLFWHVFWIIWYPAAYWMLAMATAVVALPKTLFSRRGSRGLWVSPDRGVRPVDPWQPPPNARRARPGG